MIKELTCIICPMGCSLKVEVEGDKVMYVEGNNCSRGKKYAISEFTDPQRTITTTMKCDNGEVLPVKTDRTIPKDKIFECMKIINSNVIHLPVSVGDVIIENVYGSNVVVVRNMEK